MGDYNYGYDYDDNSSNDQTTNSAKVITTPEPEDDFQLFESVTEIIRYTKEEIGNIKEFPFLAEEKAYQVLNKIKGFKWPRKERRRKLFDSNVEDVCVEDLCTKEEMQEDYENWPVAQQISNGKIPDESFQKYLECYKSIDGKGKVRSNFKKLGIIFENSACLMNGTRLVCRRSMMNMVDFLKK